MQILFFIITFTLLFFSTNLHADEEATTGIYGQLGYNGFLFDSDRPIDDTDDFYLGLGYQLSEHWATDIRYSEADFDFDSPGLGEGELEFYAIDALYRLQPRNQSSFFWKAGLGKLKFNNSSQRGPHYILGAGYESYLGNKFSLVFGLDAAYINKGNSHLDYIPYLALNYFWGGRSEKKQAKIMPPPEPKTEPKTVPKDSDNDGVNDEIDQCPKSRQNAKVDDNGCELDTDGDGIFDGDDRCPATPAGAKVDSTGCREILTEDVSITLNVKFANNSNEVTPDFHDEIKTVADFMRQYPDTNVVIEGHTDDRGAASYNQQLSQKRAQAVMDYLINNLSIEPSRVSAVGKGEVYPIADNTTAKGRAINRRVQAEIKTSVSRPQ